MRLRLLAYCFFCCVACYTDLLLALGSPLGSLVLASLFELITLLLGLVNGGLGVLSRCVHGEQAQGCRSGVDD
jgi:H+/Cl- antiporter ClcA